MHKTRSELEKCKGDLLLLQEELGEDLSPEYCNGCLTTLQDVARSMLTMHDADGLSHNQKSRTF